MIFPLVFWQKKKRTYKWRHRCFVVVLLLLLIMMTSYNTIFYTIQIFYQRYQDHSFIVTIFSSRLHSHIHVFCLSTAKKCLAYLLFLYGFYSFFRDTEEFTHCWDTPTIYCYTVKQPFARRCIFPHRYNACAHPINANK